jgi:hypothetical protein
MTATPGQDQDQAAPAPAPGTAPEWYADATLDALELAQQRRRADRQAEAEHAKATAEGPCSRCGCPESWLKPGRGGWHRDARGPVCQPCNLDMRSFQREQGAIIGDDEHRARVIIALVGEAEARWQYPPILVARSRDLLAWYCETPGARPGEGGERFGYVDVPTLVASLHAPPPPPPTLLSRGRKVRCPNCGAKGQVWTCEQVAVSAPVDSRGELSRVQRAHFRVTWTCHTCWHADVEQRAEQVRGVPVGGLVGG